MTNNDIDKIYLGSDSVSKVFLGTDLVWPYTPPVPPTPVSGDYLTFEILTGGTINWKTYNSANTKTISYSKNGGAWTDITASTGGTSFNVDAGDTVLFKAENGTYSGNTFRDSTSYFNLSGNIMSLLYGDDFEGEGALSGESVFYILFSGAKVVNAGGLSLPATTLTVRCYSYMFKDCTSLTTAPVLPATTLANSCYASMFENCPLLRTAPALPATTLEGGCYTEMFSGCTSLTTAPALPATQLTLAPACYQAMFAGCTSLTTAPALPATSLTNYCYDRMFAGCTSLTTAPVLPATTLDDSCYQYMFHNCSSLNYIKCLATNISTILPDTEGWVYNVASAGTFVKAASATWETGDSGIPSGWTIIDDQ